jgi:hypothetical protein
MKRQRNGLAERTIVPVALSPGAVWIEGTRNGTAIVNDQIGILPGTVERETQARVGVCVEKIESLTQRETD